MISSKTTFKGYRRENGRVGIRNHVLILPVDDLTNAAAEAVANNVKGAIAIPHPFWRRIALSLPLSRTTGEGRDA